MRYHSLRVKPTTVYCYLSPMEHAIIGQYDERFSIVPNTFFRIVHYGISVLFIRSITCACALHLDYKLNSKIRWS